MTDYLCCLHFFSLVSNFDLLKPSLELADLSMIYCFCFKVIRIFFKGIQTIYVEHLHLGP